MLLTLWLFQGLMVNRTGVLLSRSLVSCLLKLVKRRVYGAFGMAEAASESI